MQYSNDLAPLGWDEWFEAQFLSLELEGIRPARVAVQHRGAYLLYEGSGEAWGQITGRLRSAASQRSDMPAVGDWVAVRDVEGDLLPIVARLERKTELIRTESGNQKDAPHNRFVRVDEQVLAANLDMVFVVAALTEEFNVRRIERYLTMIYEGGAAPVIVLNKCDLKDPTRELADLTAVAAGSDVYPISALTGEGVETLALLLEPGRTVALVGSSGVGKTSLVNVLSPGSHRPVAPTRSDDRGRHTTTQRELIRLESGALLIDTPGIRELQLAHSDQGIEQSFDDVADLAGRCRFNDCAHQAEPGCSVKEALENGSLPRDRFDSYMKLSRELAFLERRKDPALERANQQKWKAIAKSARKRARPRP